jgi:hypothetical protein
VLKQILMELNMYIMTPDPLSTSCSIPSISLCVCMRIILSLLGIRMTKTLHGNEYTRNFREIIAHIVFWLGHKAPCTYLLLKSADEHSSACLYSVVD